MGEGAMTVTSAGAWRFGGRLSLVCIAVLTAFAGGGSNPAAAQSPSYDPDSPAGQQYAIPVDAARSTGAASHGGSVSAQPGGSSANDGAAGGAVLFGEGMGHAKQSTPSSGSRAASPSSGKPGKQTDPAVATAAVSSSEVPSFRPAGSTVTGPAVALITGLVVLAAGAVLAAMTTRRRRMARDFR
jgi:hypothetical protein